MKRPEESASILFSCFPNANFKMNFLYVDSTSSNANFLSVLFSVGAQNVTILLAKKNCNVTYNCIFEIKLHSIQNY